MKKILYILIILLLVTGCGKEKKLKKLESKREEKTMLTCSAGDVTYMFYYSNDKDPYYKADYLEKKVFDSDEEAIEYQEEFFEIWVEKYADELLSLEYRENEKTSFINISAMHDTKEEIYKEFFGDRYNLKMDDMNKTFANNCLIKPIKK